MNEKKPFLKTLRRTLPAVALMAIPAVVFAGQGPYVGVEGGVNWLHSETFYNQVSPGSNNRFGYAHGYLGGLTAGYAFANGLRSELELDYRRNSIHGGGSVKAATAIANIWYDYKTTSGIFHIVHPYLGGGVGFGRLGVRQGQGYKSAFVYQAGAGLDFDVTSHLTASLNYRWMQSGRYNLLENPKSNARYRSQAALIGVRYSFGSTAMAAMPPTKPATAPPPPPPPPAKPVCHAPAGFKVDKNCHIIPQKIILRSVNFKLNKAQLTDAARSTLDGVAASLRQQPKLQVEIDGYTDSTGSATSNLALSQRRAEAVRSYLISDGVKASSLTAHGYGAANPVAGNQTSEGRARNRRVEFQVKQVPAHVKVVQQKPTQASVQAATH